MDDYSLKGIVWGSVEFDEVMSKAKHKEMIAEDKRIIDEALTEIKTEEGQRYLIDSIKG